MPSSWKKPADRARAYLGAVVDRTLQRVVIMASTEGGVEIEKLRKRRLIKFKIMDPLVGVMPFKRGKWFFNCS